jgi:hypothetical protein
MIAHLQYSTLEAQVAHAVVEANQVSIRAKDAPVMVNAERYELVSNTLSACCERVVQLAIGN